MLRVRKVKCPVCEEEFDRNTTPSLKIKNRWVHEWCLEKRIEKEMQKFSTPERQAEHMEEFMQEVTNALQQAKVTAEKRKKLLLQKKEEERIKEEKALELIEQAKEKQKEKREIRSKAREIGGENKDRNMLIGYLNKLYRGNINPRAFAQMEDFRWNKGFTYKDQLASLIYFYDVRRGDISKAQGGIGIIPYVVEEAIWYFQQQAKKQEAIKEAIVETKEPKIQKTRIIKRDNGEKKSPVEILDLSELE